MQRGKAALRLVQQAGALQAASASANAQAAAAALPQLVRQMGGNAHPETPLSKIMPTVVTIPRQAVTTALSLTGKLIVGTATSGAAKSVVTSIADKVVVDEALVDLAAVDSACWTYWLSTLGYTNQAGYKKLVEAAKPKVAGMCKGQITNLTVGLYNVKYYDKDLFTAIAANVSANFTKFETEQLLKIVKAFAEFNHYSQDLFDDIADSIAYCNHYLAPVKAPLPDVIAGLSAFAKFKHERADALLTLARGVSEVGLSGLSTAERKAAVVAGLKAFSTFSFYPEQVDALLYYTTAEAGEFSADELKLASEVKAAIEAQVGGSLETFPTGSEEDTVHWFGHHNHGPSNYELYVFRDSLVPKSYSPQAFRPQK